MVFHTWKNHAQKYECVVDCDLPVDIEDKIRGIAKFILDNLRILIADDFTSERQTELMHILIIHSLIIQSMSSRK